MPKEEVEFVVKALKKNYPFVKLNDPIDLPAKAYTPLRKRYRADSLINFLAGQTGNGSVTIGITDKDISTTKGNISDWGVMGLGFCPGNACVASTFRLAKENKSDQLFKIAIHELGHTMGLSHCKVATCFMRDAEGGNPINEEKEFCSDCKAALHAKGWKFN
ncbi:MAG: matrixin family metalloprotease [Chitinophagaceae bacterium]